MLNFKFDIQRYALSSGVYLYADSVKLAYDDGNTENPLSARNAKWEMPAGYLTSSVGKTLTLWTLNQPVQDGQIYYAAHVRVGLASGNSIWSLDGRWPDEVTVSNAVMNAEYAENFGSVTDLGVNNYSWQSTYSSSDSPQSVTVYGNGNSQGTVVSGLSVAGMNKVNWETLSFTNSTTAVIDGAEEGTGDLTVNGVNLASGTMTYNSNSGELTISAGATFDSFTATNDTKYTLQDELSFAIANDADGATIDKNNGTISGLAEGAFIKGGLSTWTVNGGSTISDLVNGTWSANTSYQLVNGELIVPTEVSISGGETFTVGEATSSLTNVKVSGSDNIVNVKSGAAENLKIKLSGVVQNKNTVNIFAGVTGAEITAGSNADTITSAADAVINMQTNSKTLISATNGANLTVNNYSNSGKAKILVGGVSAISRVPSMLLGSTIQLEDGAIKTSTGTVSFEGIDSDYTLAQLVDSSGDAIKVAFTNSDGGSIDMSSKREAFVLVGNNTGDKGESELLGGRKNDTIVGGEGDYIDAGAGTNTIILNNNHDSAGATIALSNQDSGTVNIVQNFTFGYEDDSDALEMDLTKSNFNYSDGNLTVMSGKAVTRISTDEEVAELKINSDNEIYYAKLATKADVTLDIDDTEEARVFEASGIDLTAYSESVNLNLASGVSEMAGETAYFKRVSNVVLGEGDSTIIGTAGDNIIEVGAGNAMIMSLAGNDKLIAYSDSDKTGVTNFVYGSGKDTISGLTEYTAENAQTADIITAGNNALTDFDFKVVKDDVVAYLNGNENNTLTLEDMAGKDFKFGNNFIVQVNSKNLTYDGAANVYIATNSKATLTVSDEVEGDLNLNLSNNTLYSENFTAVDASSASGYVTITGNNSSNKLTAGSGGSELWGGADSANDTLIGGSGVDTFIYNIGEGNDTIKNATGKDIVNLGDATIDDIKSLKTSSSSVIINFNDGSKLTSNLGGQTYLFDNVEYKFNSNTKKFVEV